jgi:hypothetical protein
VAICFELRLKNQWMMSPLRRLYKGDETRDVG